LNNADLDAQRSRREGLLASLIAYVLWGLFPIYFILVASVAPLEVLAHRIIWAVPFGALILYFRKQWREVRPVWGDRNMLFWLALAALCISCNWLIYIWAVQQEMVLQTSLGYFINPLIYVLVGVLFLHERLRRTQVVSVALAAIGVLYLTFTAGEFPWVAISLATLFTMYGVIRKQVAIGAMPGLFIETVLLFPFAAAWLGWLLYSGSAALADGDIGIKLLLIAGGPITVIPLLLFAVGARRLSLTVIGFMQFVAPSLQFLVGIYFGEKLTQPLLVCFAFIWTAIVIFSIDAYMNRTRTPPRIAPAES
jgi:chloramphenicol-sensitive protein RarD